MRSAKKRLSKSSASTAASGKRSTKFTDEELEAMKDRLGEMEAKPRKGSAEGENAVLAKIATLPKPDRAMAERLHAIIKANVPALLPKTWYGMPAYAKDGNVVCFFQSAQKFKTRYATLGFSDRAKLDEGSMWPTAYALKELTEVEETRIEVLIRKAVM